MMIRIFAALAAVLASCQALTDSEASKFSNDGSQGGTITLTASGSSNWVLKSNGLPDHSTQKVNPNTATAQNYEYTMPKNPTVLDTPTCTTLGPIGFSVNGVPLFNPLTNEEENAVEGPGEETFDSCDGHPTNRGEYHYHKLPTQCLYKHAVDELVGVALDGIPIYGPNVSDKSVELTGDDLDDCHGRMFNGQYRYHMTRQWPYMIGCYKGQVIDSRVRTSACSMVKKNTLCYCSRDGTAKVLIYENMQTKEYASTGSKNNYQIPMYFVFLVVTVLFAR